ncbi:MAG: class I SAM-dependent methyltransferase [Acidimicrobiales bacterium]
MARGDAHHWDEKYRATAQALPTPCLPDRFARFADLFRSAADALEIACGAGAFTVWLALQGVHTTAFDISATAVAQAKELAAENEVADSCDIGVADFDEGLPAGSQVDLVVCNMFRDASLDEALVARLRPGGTLAIAALSEVGAEPGRFRVAKGELPVSFVMLDALASGEGDGIAWLVATRH